MSDENLKTLRTLHWLCLVIAATALALSTSPVTRLNYDAAIAELDALRAVDWEAGYPYGRAHADGAIRDDSEQLLKCAQVGKKGTLLLDSRVVEFEDVVHS